MKYRPLIGITAGEIVNKDEPWAPITYGQSSTYVQAIVHAGGIPVILPLVEDENVNRQLFDRCDAILFAGGNDIDPELYGESVHASVTDISKLRDLVEMRYMRWTLELCRPLLGICRGMELLNVACGGTLHQDIASVLPDASDHNLSTAAKDIEHIAHNLRIDERSRLAKLLHLSSVGANTHHHQAVHEIGEGLRPVAWAEDNIVEAIESTDGRFAIGIQSHPESLEASAEAAWANLFRGFVQEAEAFKRTSA